MTYKQTTIATAVSFEGIGIHSGEVVGMEIRPAGAGEGITFVHSGARIAAVSANAGPANRSTSLTDGEVSAHTVEHVLSALYGLGIDNAEIELTAPEPPALDGSPLPVCLKLLDAGIIELGVAAEYFTVRAPVFTEKGASAAIALPYNGFRVSSFISYDHAMIPEQAFDSEVTPETYEKEIAPARTYGFIEEIQALLAAGLGKGGSEDNAVIIYPARYSVELRFDNEPVRHKAADMIGDLALLGRRARGHFIGFRSGHDLNCRLTAGLARVLAI